MRGSLRSIVPALFLLAFVTAPGCTTGVDDAPATAPPTTTGIPIGAPGAKGVAFDPPVVTATARAPGTEGIEQKINPSSPATPPSPFATPPDDEDDPDVTPPPIKKKAPKGTNL